MIRHNRFSTLTLAFAVLVAFAVPAAFAGGPPGGVIWAHDMTYRTVGTPTNLPEHGKFDTIYTFDDFDAVSDAAPGDMDFNGGRWEVRHVTFLSGDTQFTNAEQIEQAAANGDIMIGEVVKRFECPMIPVH